MKSFAKSMLTILGTVLIADGLRKMSNVPGLSFQTTPKLVRVGSEFININDIKGIRLCEKRTNRRYVIQITLNNGNVLSPEFFMLSDMNAALKNLGVTSEVNYFTQFEKI